MTGFTFKKIRHRVFLSIFLTLTLLITGILAFELLFFDDWYLDRKISALEKNIAAVSEEIEDLAYMEEDFYRITDRFEEENGAIINIMGRETMVDFLNDDTFFDDLYYEEEIILVVRSEEGEYFYLFLGDLPYEDYMDYAESLGDEIYVMGELDEDLIYPVIIEDWLVEDGWLEVLPEELLEDGVMEGIAEEIFGDGVPYYEGDVTVMEVLGEALEPFNLDYEAYEKENITIIDDGFLSFMVYQPFSNILTIVYEKDVALYDGTPATIYVEASLQSVDEVMAAVVPFFIVFYLLGFLVVLFLAGYLSGKITGPIIAMTEQAKRIAGQDFTARVQVTTEDELGQLGSSINDMSDSMEQALIELKGANRQLLRDIEKERKLEQQRRSFIANASHELKTPLGIAKGYLEAVQDGIRQDKQETYLRIVMNEMDRMNKIVLNMLELMKLEENRELELTPRSLKPYLDEMEAYFAVMLKEKAMTLTIEAQDLAVMAETATIRSLLMNLISNAVNYGVGGTVVEVVCQEKNGYAQLSVSNTVANPEDLNLERIWHKFYTGDRSHNRKGSGTGLGLSIVKGIMDQYGAAYDVRIEAGRFVFTCSLKTAESMRDEF